MGDQWLDFSDERWKWMHPYSQGKAVTSERPYRRRILVCGYREIQSQKGK